jgi:putative transposase
VPAPNKRGRPRTHGTREILNAIFYVLKSGYPWRLLPKDFPPWETVYWWFGRWRLDGTFERLNAALRDELGYCDRLCAPAWKRSSTWQ